MCQRSTGVRVDYGFTVVMPTSARIEGGELTTPIASQHAFGRGLQGHREARSFESNHHSVHSAAMLQKFTLV